MPQGLLHHFKIDPGREHERRRAVAQIMQPDRRQVGSDYKIVEMIADRCRVQRFPVLTGEHFPGVHPH